MIHPVRAPEFWRRGGILGLALAPAGWCYGLCARVLFAAAHPVRAAVPVLCVGNFVIGGAGKTPVALSIGRRLIDRGRKVHFLSRGYGGRAAGPLRVDPQNHTAADVGDEALLLAAHAPAWVSRDRVAGVRAAATVPGDAEVILMDDGFQNASVSKDLSLLVVDGEYGFGNGRVIPAGPLRETVSSALSRADVIVLIGEDIAGIENHPAVKASRLPVLKAHTRPGPEAESLKGQPVVAFAGIANPEKFFRTLEEAGSEIKVRHAFPDHHPFGEGDIQRLKSEAAGLNAKLVTTEKDAMRLSPAALSGIVVLTISLQWEDEAALDAALDPLFGA